MTQSELIEDESGAILSPCRIYRYLLTRRWAPTRPADTIAFILLNPSTADENVDDPTIRRCVGFAKTLGYGGLVVANLFALRSTDPGLLVHHVDPIGPDNDKWLHEVARKSQQLICGWGCGGIIHRRGTQVLKLLSEAGASPKALKITARGHPAYPLYLRHDLQPRELPQ